MINSSIPLPSTGFINGIVGSSTLTIRIVQHIQQSALCNSIKFESLSDKFKPFIKGSDVFSLQHELGDSINGRFTWFNGVESISKVSNDEDFITWIVSPNEPGIFNNSFKRY